MIYSVKYTKIACSLFHVITASRGVGYDWRTLLVVPSTSNARISLPGWSRYVSAARLDFLVGFRCKMVFDASTLWQVRGAMHTMSISSPLKDYTLPSTDITTLTKQRDDPLQDRCTRIHIHIYPILSRPRVRKMHFKEIFMRLATYVVWRTLAVRAWSSRRKTSYLKHDVSLKLRNRYKKECSIILHFARLYYSFVYRIA